jgi:hypothetical protein
MTLEPHWFQGMVLGGKWGWVFDFSLIWGLSMLNFLEIWCENSKGTGVIVLLESI